MELKVHERQTARMRTRSEWFLGGCGSLELGGDMHLRPPSINTVNGGSGNLITMCGNGTGNLGATGAGIGTYHSHDDLAHFRNENFLLTSPININNYHHNSTVHHVNVNLSHSFGFDDNDNGFAGSNSILSLATSTTFHNNHSNNFNRSHNLNYHHHQHANNSRQRNNNGVLMMVFTVLDFLF